MLNTKALQQQQQKKKLLKKKFCWQQNKGILSDTFTKGGTVVNIGLSPY